MVECKDSKETHLSEKFSYEKNKDGEMDPEHGKSI
jgi:hypothetical protein